MICIFTVGCCKPTIGQTNDKKQANNALWMSNFLNHFPSKIRFVFRSKTFPRNDSLTQKRSKMFRETISCLPAFNFFTLHISFLLNVLFNIISSLKNGWRKDVYSLVHLTFHYKPMILCTFHTSRESNFQVFFVRNISALLWNMLISYAKVELIINIWSKSYHKGHTVESRFLEPPGEMQVGSRNREFEKLKVASNYV